MNRTRIVLALAVVVCVGANVGAQTAPSYSQRLVGTVTETGATRPSHLKVRMKVQGNGTNDSVSGWGHWGIGASSLGGLLSTGQTSAFTIWLADDRARLCTLSGTPALPTGASFGVGTVSGAYTCIDYTGAANGGGTFTLKRPPRAAASPPPMGMPGY